MKKNLLLFFLFVSLYSVAQKKTCEDFKTGKFQNIEDGVLRATIERNDSIQVERYGPILVKLKVKWLDECSYQLTFIEGNKAFWDTRTPDAPTDDMIVKILKINGSSYLQESKFLGNDEIIYQSNIEKID